MLTRVVPFPPSPVRANNQFVQRAPLGVVFTEFLLEVLGITNSEYGFISQIFKDEVTGVAHASFVVIPICLLWC